MSFDGKPAHIIGFFKKVLAFVPVDLDNTEVEVYVRKWWKS